MPRPDFPYPTATDPFGRLAADLPAVASQCTGWWRNEEEGETLALLEQATGKFLKRWVDEERIDREKDIDASVLQRAAELGLFGLTIPTRYGGAGLSFKATCRLVDVLSRWDRSLGVTVGLHAGLGLRGLLAYGSPELKQRYLPHLASGEMIACFPVTETEAGSDIASLRTSARQQGDELVITGSKIYATNAGFASLATLVARTPGLGGARRGHSMILVPLDRPGVERGAEENKLGIRGSSTRSLHFEEVRVGMDHLLGSAARGLDQLAYVLTWGRTIMAGGCLGLARRAQQLALTQACQRRQFGRPLAHFGMIQQKLAEAEADIFLMESILRLVTSLEDALPASVVWESSVAKVFCSEATWRVVDESLQIHGGSGYIEDTGVARLLRDARISRIFEGANEVLRYHLAVGLVTLKDNPAEQLKRLRLQGPAAGYQRRVVKQAGQLVEVLSSLKQRYGIKLIHRQMNLRYLADAAISLYLQLAVLARLQGQHQQNLADDAYQQRLAEHCLERLAGQLQHDLQHCDDPGLERLARLADERVSRSGLLQE